MMGKCNSVSSGGRWLAFYLRFRLGGLPGTIIEFTVLSSKDACNLEN